MTENKYVLNEIQKREHENKSGQIGIGFFVPLVVKEQQQRQNHSQYGDINYR
jgi:hypothetical protein